MSIRLNIPSAKTPFVPTQYISLVLSGSIISSQPFFVASYEDSIVGVFSSEATNTGTANGTTPVTILGTPNVTISRKLTFLSITNSDTAQVTVTISINTVTGAPPTQQTQTVTLYECTLQPNYTLVYNEEDNFKVFDQNGVCQEGNSSGVGSFYQQAESLGVNLTPRPAYNAYSGLIMADNPSWMRTDILMANSGVAPGTYGGAGKYLTITVNAKGQITAISST